MKSVVCFTGSFEINSIHTEVDVKKVLQIARSAVPDWVIRHDCTYLTEPRSGWKSKVCIHWVGTTDIKTARKALIDAFANEINFDFIKTRLKLCNGRYSRAILSEEVLDACLYQMAPICRNQPNNVAFLREVKDRWIAT